MARCYAKDICRGDLNSAMHRYLRNQNARRTRFYVFTDLGHIVFITGSEDAAKEAVNRWNGGVYTRTKAMWDTREGAIIAVNRRTVADADMAYAHTIFDELADSVTPRVKTLRDELPGEALGPEWDDDCKFRTLLDNEVIREHSITFNDDTSVRWPGREKNVRVWWEVENGYAVGWNENPSRGWSFPTIRYSAKSRSRKA